MSLKLKDTELNKLIDEVVSELNGTFGDLKEKLSKAAPEESPGDESAAPPAAPAAEASESPEMSDDAGSMDAGAPPPEAPSPSADPAQDMGGELTPEALQAEYEKLPPDELQMHKMALEAALAKLGGGDMGAGAPPPGGDMPPAAPPSAPPMAMKSEKSNEAVLAKSEELNLAKNEITSLKEDVEILTKTIKTLIETPVRKAITSITELPKEDEDDGVYKSLAPNEFWAKLKEVAKRQDLKKSDKDLIMDIYDRRVSPEVAAKHLARLFSEE
jgi:hypothetical protein